MSYKRNSEYWYRDMQPLWMHVRRWLISTGLETPHWTPAGYSYRLKDWSSLRLSFRARGSRSRLFALYHAFCPLSLFGGRLTFQPFGVSWYSRGIGGWYCLHYTIENPGPHWHKRWYAYRSHNATPWGADTWYVGAPRDVIRAADAQAAKMSAERERRMNGAHDKAASS